MRGLFKKMTLQRSCDIENLLILLLKELSENSSASLVNVPLTVFSLDLQILLISNDFPR